MTVPNDARLLDAEASRELYSLLARCTGSVAAMVVRSVTGLDGVEVRSKLHANYSRRALGENVQCAARMHVSESSEGRESGESGNPAMGGKGGRKW